MRPARPVRALLLAVLGFALLVNLVWLFPNEGSRQYTYDRAEITVENGTFDYRESGLRATGHEWNDLAPVACDARDGGRACAFDQYLAANGPVTIPDDEGYESRRAFVRLDDGYYHRTIEPVDDGATYDVERIAPRDLLAEVATNASLPPSADVGDLPFETRVAVTGDPASTTEVPDRDEVGQVYLVNGTYYTVVVTEEGTVDTPVFAEWMRLPLSLLGMALLVVALIVGVGDRESTLRAGRR